MSTRSTSSPVPILIIIVLAMASLIQLFAPGLIDPGLTLLAIGIVFLILHLFNWVREPLTLVSGWVLSGFGLSLWALTLELFAQLSVAAILFGLGLAFVGIYFTTPKGKEIDAHTWPAVPGVLLLLIGLLLVLEGSIGRERLWSLAVPLIPSVVAVWFIIDWRRRVEPRATEETSPPE
ncbi:MAG: hypothetical protein ACE5M4_15920 [Anaerolineales bacterium]